jgi:hypothetical protein
MLLDKFSNNCYVTVLMIMSDLSASVLKPNKKTLSLPANAHQRSVTIVYKDEVRFLRQQNSEQQHVFV